MIAVSLALTLLVEFIVLLGDISRMNTVFKFYLEVWELFSISAAAGLAWLLAEQVRWGRRWRLGWNFVLGFLVLGAALYPLAATPAKMKDRMTDLAPHTLDGMDFMPYADRGELGERFSLESEYHAIRWMQDNVQGTPVIVEANIPEYRWGSRFTIYTGLPGILGWNNHQRQQRVSAEPGVVEKRAEEILDFYLTRSVEEAQDFLDRYNVRYVVLGNVERIYFEEIYPCLPVGDGKAVTCDLRGLPWGMESPDVPASDCYSKEDATEGPELVCPTHGLEKFETMAASGILSVAYQEGDVVIYEVMQ
jgi:uncharacterized membrane protein